MLNSEHGSFGNIVFRRAPQSEHLNSKGWAPPPPPPPLSPPPPGIRIAGIALMESLLALFGSLGSIWEFPKRRGTLFWGPYNRDPTI